MKASELFRRAAMELRVRGHAKFSLQDELGGVCLMGALNAVTTCDPHEFPHWDDRSMSEFCGDGNAYGEVLPILLQAVKPECKLAQEHRTKVAHSDRIKLCMQMHTVVIDWNNADERLPSEVIEALDRAAEIAQESEG